MELKIRKIGNGYGVLLPKQLLDELALEEGSMLAVEKVDGTYRMVPADAQFTRQVEAFCAPSRSIATRIVSSRSRDGISAC